VYPPFKLSASQLALFWQFYNPTIYKPKPTIEERNKGSRVFSNSHTNGYSSSLLFICLQSGNESIKHLRQLQIIQWFVESLTNGCASWTFFDVLTADSDDQNIENGLRPQE
jgi:hypothetical protein